MQRSSKIVFIELPSEVSKPMRKPTSQPSSSTSYRGGGQQAHVTEASVVDLMPVGSATTFNVEFSENPEIYQINVTQETYGQEPAEIFVVGGLAEALSTSTRSPGILEGDKEYVAAVDTACNKTCAGEQWIRLMRDCLKRAPHYIQALVDEQPTTDFFKFGNGGVLTSQLRVRLPVCLMGHARSSASIVDHWVMTPGGNSSQLQVDALEQEVSGM